VPVSFGWSAGQEALASLAVLSNIRRYPLHVSWALRIRALLSPALRDEADQFAFWYLDRPLVLREIWPHGHTWTWEEDLAALRTAPVELVAEQFIHGSLAARNRADRVNLARFLDDAGLRQLATSRVLARHPPSVPVIEQLIEDPGAFRDRFAGFLAAYWDACLAPDWPGLAAQMRADIARRGVALSRLGIRRALTELSPHIRPGAGADEVTIQPPDGRGGLAELVIELTDHDEILLAPSHFVWPELSAVHQKDPAADGERQTLLITYAVAAMQQEGAAPVAPEHLLKLLRSSGDATRLQILKLLAQRPRSTRELAGLIGLTEAAISKHLKQLQDAGWVSAERRSYYVYYRVVHASLHDLVQGLEQLLGHGDSDTL
jgi:DNA-binding transcriptional ArsR family regulator